MRLARAIGVAVSLLVLFIATAMAAPPSERWLLLPSHAQPRDTWTSKSTMRLSEELSRLGVDVWNPSEAASELERTLSRPPQLVTPRELAEWGSNLAEGQRTLALGEYGKALSALEKAHALATRAPETLLRERDRARRVLDNCIHIVRAFVESERSTEARRQATECRQLLPSQQPTAGLHPPWVLEVLEEVDAARYAETGQLRITSAPEGCLARINGVATGATPLEIPHLFSGRYHVQVACDFEHTGRVHVAQVESTRADVFVDTRLDEALETHPNVALRYAGTKAQTLRQYADLARVGSALGSTHAVLIAFDDPKTVSLSLVEISGSESQPKPGKPNAIAKVRSRPEGPTAQDLRRAAEALTTGRCVDLTGAAPEKLPCAR